MTRSGEGARFVVLSPTRGSYHLRLLAHRMGSASASMTRMVARQSVPPLATDDARSTGLFHAPMKPAG